MKSKSEILEGYIDGDNPNYLHVCSVEEAMEEYAKERVEDFIFNGMPEFKKWCKKNGYYEGFEYNPQRGWWFDKNHMMVAESFQNLFLQFKKEQNENNQKS